jgi:hypothetical protein
MRRQPNRNRRSRLRTRLLAVAACIALFATSGCLFLRLLEVRRQLGDFDANFVVSVEDGLTVSFLNPVILERDLRLVGLPPTRIETDETGSDWIHVFAKQYPDRRTEDSDFDLILFSRFAGGRLSALHIDESYFAHVPKDNVLLTIRSFGNADLDISDRQARMEVPDEDASPGIPPPDLLDILNTLGLPYARSDTDGERWFEYRYRLQPPPSAKTEGDDDPGGKIYRLKFTFGRKDRIVGITGTLPLIGRVEISYK